MNRSVLTGATGLDGGSVLRDLARQGEVSRVTSLGADRAGYRHRTGGKPGSRISPMRPNLNRIFAGAETVVQRLAACRHRVERDRYRQITVGFLNDGLDRAMIRDARKEARPQAVFENRDIPHLTGG